MARAPLSPALEDMVPSCPANNTDPGLGLNIIKESSQR